MSKAMVLPIIAVICLVLKSAFGIEIGADVQGQIADAIVVVSLAVVAVIGIVKDNKKKDLPK